MEEIRRRSSFVASVWLTVMSAMILLLPLHFLLIDHHDCYDLSPVQKVESQHNCVICDNFTLFHAITEENQTYSERVDVLLSLNIIPNFPEVFPSFFNARLLRAPPVLSTF